MLHVIAATLSLLLLTGMFRASPETAPDERPGTPAKQQHPGQETGTIESDA